MRFIKLTRDQVAIVDDEKYEELNQYKWYANWNYGNNYYACRCTKDGRKLLMHRVVMDAPRGLCVDHINGNTLDNRMQNLRLASIRENAQNRHHNKSSKYPGVNWSKQCSKWVSAIRIKGERHFLGNYESEHDAFKAYVNACIEYGISIERIKEIYGPMA